MVVELSMRKCHVGGRSSDKKHGLEIETCEPFMNG